jgi:hypothetical protein
MSRPNSKLLCQMEKEKNFSFIFEQFYYFGGKMILGLKQLAFWTKRKRSGCMYLDYVCVCIYIHTCILHIYIYMCVCVCVCVRVLIDVSGQTL